MKTATVREAQHHLAKLLAEVERSGEIVLTRRGKPVGKLLGMGDSLEKNRQVCWAESLRKRDEALHDLPASQRDTVGEMRGEEQY